VTQYSYIPDEKALEVGDSINTSVAQIALQKVKVFKEEYLEMSPSLFESQENRNGLSHTGEFGRFREKLVQNLLQQFLPARLSVGDGFMVPFLTKRSTQCDVIVYDRDSSPHMQSPGGLVMFPPEVCAAVGEVKSSLTMAEAKEALKNLAKIKQIRNEMKVHGLAVAPSAAVVLDHYEMFSAAENGQSGISEATYAALSYKPEECEHQALVTFLVCAEIEFPKPKAGQSGLRAFEAAVHDLMDGTPHNLRPNFILSLRQGFLSYMLGIKGENDEVHRIPYSYPVQSVRRIEGVEDNIPASTGIRWLPAQNDYRHIMQFVSELAIAANRVPIYHFTPQMHALDPKSYDYHYFPSK